MDGRVKPDHDDSEWPQFAEHYYRERVSANRERAEMPRYEQLDESRLDNEQRRI